MTVGSLVLEGDEVLRAVCIEAIRGLAIHAFNALSLNEAFTILEQRSVDIMFVDSSIPWPKCRACGARKLNPGPTACCVEFLHVVKKKFPFIDVVLITDSGPPPSKSESIEVGTWQLTKPFTHNEITLVIESLLQKREVPLTSSGVRGNDGCAGAFPGFVGTSPEMEEVFRLIGRVCQTRHPLLIVGETGTGKDLVARIIHNSGPWKDHPFVPIDCATLTPTLIESELFGHVRGAFTGAYQTRPGLLSLAGTRTVLLDEIAELPIQLQVKLLRILQDGEFRPKEGITGVSDEVMDVLMRYDWPGNVRELENCVQHALALGSGPLVQVPDLPSNLFCPAGSVAGNSQVVTIQELERQAILQAVEATEGDCQRAATLLGIGKTTIYRKLKEYGIADGWKTLPATWVPMIPIAPSPLV